MEVWWITFLQNDKQHLLLKLFSKIFIFDCVIAIFMFFDERCVLVHLKKNTTLITALPATRALFPITEKSWDISFKSYEKVFKSRKILQKNIADRKGKCWLHQIMLTIANIWSCNLKAVILGYCLVKFHKCNIS